MLETSQDQETWSWIIYTLYVTSVLRSLLSPKVTPYAHHPSSNLNFLLQPSHIPLFCWNIQAQDCHEHLVITDEISWQASGPTHLRTLWRRGEAKRIPMQKVWALTKILWWPHGHPWGKPALAPPGDISPTLISQGIQCPTSGPLDSLQTFFQCPRTPRVAVVPDNGQNPEPVPKPAFQWAYSGEGEIRPRNKPKNGTHLQPGGGGISCSYKLLSIN